jgi:hypothetical protein
MLQYTQIINKTYLEHIMTRRSSLLKQIVCTTLVVLSLPLQAENTAHPDEQMIASNPAITPVLDGQLDEWQTLTEFNSLDNRKKSHANNRLYWQQTWLAHDVDNLYIAYHNQGTIPKNDWWAWEVYLDTDHNPKTGYSEFNNLGAEYLLQGNELYQYVGNGKIEQEWDKKWKYIGYAQGQINKKTGMNAELSIPLKWLQLTKNESSEPLTLHVLFYGDNEVFGGEGEDRHQGAEGYFAYQINPTITATATAAATTTATPTAKN